MNTYFTIAAALSLINTGLHLFMGGKEIARPLLDSRALSEEVRSVLYYCWHLATLTLVFQTVLFAVLAFGPQNTGLAMAATGLAASFAVVGIAMAPALKVGYRVLPQGWLFVPVTALGLAGLLA